MTIKTVRYSRRVQVDRFEPAELEMTAELTDTDDPVAAAQALAEAVAALLNVPTLEADLEGAREALAET